MDIRFPLGRMVRLKNPLPGEQAFDWKVVGFNLNKAPAEYKLLREKATKAGRPTVIVADENELELA